MACWSPTVKIDSHVPNRYGRQWCPCVWGFSVKLLVTGGAGFIGSNFIRHTLRTHAEDAVVCFDKLTYAGNLENLSDVADDRRYRFAQGDIVDPSAVDATVAGCDAIVNFAAQTHVDRSIDDPTEFLQTNIFGTRVLLEAVRRHRIKRMLQVSTDEVYGSRLTGEFRETDPLEPNSPYAASKASADLMCRAYRVTFGVPVVIVRCSNNYGPYQYPEKVIPFFVTRLLTGQKVPLYGDGRNVRDWLYVEDCCAGIDLALRRGADGEVYNIGGGNELPNVELTHRVLALLGKSESSIEYVKDRLGHDRRYAIDSSKIRQLGWQPRVAFEDGLQRTVRWYEEHEAWWRKLLERAEVTK